MDLLKLSRKNLAKGFAVDVRTISRWHQSGMPRNDDGSYNLPECIAWKIEQVQEDILPENAETEESQKWLTAFRRERAKLARLDRQEKEKKLLPADQVVSAWSQFITAARARLLGVRSKVAPLIIEYLPDLDERESVLGLIDSNVKEALTDLSKFELE